MKLFNKLPIRLINSIFLGLSLYTTPLQLPSTIAHYAKNIKQIPCGIKQRITFAKVIAHALWNYKNSSQHTVIEQKLADLYKTQITPEYDPQQAAQNLCIAINGSEILSIKPHEFLLGASSSAYQIEGGLD